MKIKVDILEPLSRVEVFDLLKRMTLAKTRRSFMKKSLAASVAATTPGFLSGILHANGGGGGGTGNFTKYYETTDYFYTTFDYTFIWETTYQTSFPNTTIQETTYYYTTFGETTIYGTTVFA